MTWAAMDVHARSIHAASFDVLSGELSRRVFKSGSPDQVVEWLAALPSPVRACYEAGPTGYGLYRAATGAGVLCDVIAPSIDPARERGEGQERRSRHRASAAPADGRRADADHDPDRER
jgi:hypothetical protein